MTLKYGLSLKLNYSFFFAYKSFKSPACSSIECEPYVSSTKMEFKTQHKAFELL